MSAAGLPVTQVDQVTGFPEILGGRVKRCIRRSTAASWPAARRSIWTSWRPTNLAVRLVVSNLYPFAATIAWPGVTEAEAVEGIDIGGVALTRAAAKNFESVAVLCDPADYADVLATLPRRRARSRPPSRIGA